MLEGVGGRDLRHGKGDPMSGGAGLEVLDLTRAGFNGAMVGAHGGGEKPGQKTGSHCSSNLIQPRKSAIFPR